MKNLALILAGGRGTRLDLLTEYRSKPSVPFGGKYRLIDFTLSNCVNSGIYNIGVLTQYLPRSLNNHIGIGRPWDLDRDLSGVTLLQPYTGEEEAGWYQGTAHAVYQNIKYIQEHNPDYVLVLSGDHVYKMNYKKMIDYHINKGADLTIAIQRVDLDKAHQFGILTTDDEFKVRKFEEKPEKPTSNMASMGIYVFSTDVLIEKLNQFCDKEKSDFGHHIIPEMIANNEVYTYQYDGYWKDVGTLKSFWEANLFLTNPIPKLNLYDQDWKIHTRSEEEPPVKYGKQGISVESLVSNGAIINGRVENSVISPGVVIKKGAVVKDSIIFNNTIINHNTVINKSIIDKNVTIGVDCQIGYGDDLTSNLKKPEKLNSGLNVIGKGAEIPDDTIIKRNCRIHCHVTKEDFRSSSISSGDSINIKSEID